MSDEQDLHTLATEAGIELSPQLTGAIIELLRLDVTPAAILMMLRRVMVRSAETQRQQ